MRNIFTLLVSLFLLAASGCSTTDEALRPVPVNENNSSAEGALILEELSDSDWNIVECPGSNGPAINGYDACSYLNRLSFSNTIVYVKHANQYTLTAHHICYVSGDNTLKVSTVQCGNSGWSPLFEWEIVELDNNVMTMRVTAPQIDADFSAEIEYVKVG